MPSRSRPTGHHPGHRAAHRAGDRSRDGRRYDGFATGARLAAWAGLAPGDNELVGKREKAAVGQGQPAYSQVTLNPLCDGIPPARASSLTGNHNSGDPRAGHLGAVRVG